MRIILYTGVLIAFLMPKDTFHNWAVSQLHQITDPVMTNEAVITESCFLAQRIYQGSETVLQLMNGGFAPKPKLATLRC